MVLSVFISASCMTSADCVNTGEMCSNGVCECLAGEKLVPGRCVRGKKVNSFYFILSSEINAYHNK